MTDQPRKLRSAQWFGTADKNGFMYRSWMKNQGIPDHEFNGKPIIGDGVDIGAGACVLGAVTVGDYCVIGANSVVTRDLPRGATVFGIPARPVNLRANESMRVCTPSVRP